VDNANLITLAVIGAPHGVKGEVRLKSFAADPLSIRGYGKLLARDGRAFEIDRMRPAKDVLVAKFRGVDDRNAAAKLTGLELGIDRGALPPAEADEFYHADLIGLEAFDRAGKSLGFVIAVQNFGAGDILEIAPPKSPSVLVPFTKASVPDIDVAAGRLLVVPPSEIEIEPAEEERP
jgi:16S rRNA processing protein RimM